MAARVTVKLPNLNIETPKAKEFAKIAQRLVDGIETRTTSGLDTNNRPFKKYSKQYSEQTGKTRVNLQVHNHMLGAMSNGIRAFANGFKIRLTGQQGFKAWANEEIGRKFFSMSKRQMDKIKTEVTALISKKNKLKKR